MVKMIAIIKHAILANRDSAQFAIIINDHKGKFNCDILLIHFFTFY